jgi:hypothetical protein
MHANQDRKSVLRLNCAGIFYARPAIVSRDLITSWCARYTYVLVGDARIVRRGEGGETWLLTCTLEMNQTVEEGARSREARLTLLLVKREEKEYIGEWRREGKVGEKITECERSGARSLSLSD